MADHLSDAADVMPAITGVSGCSALDDWDMIDIELVNRSGYGADRSQLSFR